MKKNAVIVGLSILWLSGASFAQTNPNAPDGTSIGVEAQGMLPMGDFADQSAFGVGGTVYIQHGVAPQFSLTGRTGFLFFGGEEIAYSTILATGTQNIDVTMIPILAGVKYFFTGGDMRPYGALEAGIFIASGSGEYTPVGGVSSSIDLDSETDVALAPSLGMQFRAGANMVVDARANFTNVFTEGTSTNWITFGIGFEWGLN